MDKTESVIPLLYDEMGKQIDMTNILMSPNAVTLRAEILETKNLSVVIQSSGVVADGYSFEEKLEYTPSTIEVKGTREELSAISEILVPASEVDLSQVKADIKVINISQYLSEGIELVDPELSTVIVTAKVIPLETKVLDLETKYYA